jgi:hypothetical protein
VPGGDYNVTTPDCQCFGDAFADIVGGSRNQRYFFYYTFRGTITNIDSPKASRFAALEEYSSIYCRIARFEYNPPHGAFELISGLLVVNNIHVSLPIPFSPAACP